MIDERDFPFLAEKGHVISLVGGGGKTTLLYAMAGFCAARGQKVFVMTTTHILQPPGGFWAQTDAALFSLWEQGQYAVAGTQAPGGKLTAPPEAQCRRWMQLADLTLIEADGAKHLPCKAPAEHEPVILPQCDIVLAVAGLSALGQPIQNVCFRPECAAELLGVSPEKPLTPELLARLLASENGGRKWVGGRLFRAVLNQADDAERRLLGRQTAQILEKTYQIQTILTCFEEGERA